MAVKSVCVHLCDLLSHEISYGDKMAAKVTNGKLLAFELYLYGMKSNDVCTASTSSIS